MLPAIEYLVRTGDIANLAKIPISLGVWSRTSSGPKYFITMERLGNSCNIALSRWDLNSFHISDRDITIKVEGEVIKEEQCLDQKIVVPDGTYPLPFMSCGVNGQEFNTYAKPMSKEQYENFFSSATNPDIHKQYRIAWVWYCFRTSMRYSGTHGNMDDYLLRGGRSNIQEFISRCNEEQRNMENSKIKLWQKICHRISIKNEGPVAGELLFRK